MRDVSEHDPEGARAALNGLKAYENAKRAAPPAPRPEVARVRGACLRDHGGTGPPVLLIPSLINPPRILDLDSDVSLAAAVRTMGRRVLLLDWGAAEDRRDLDVAGHVDQLLRQLLHSVGEPAALVGYCLGGTMAIALAAIAPCERLATLAAPWDFSLYPADAQRSLGDIWRHARPAAEALGALPMEVLQAAFWSLDPARTVAKFVAFGTLAPGSAAAKRFVALEDWANEGEALPLPAARELIEDLFGENLPGKGSWRVGGQASDGRPAVPTLHLLAARDRIAPAATAPPGEQAAIDSGHVGMIVGSARAELHDRLRRFLDPACR